MFEILSTCKGGGYRYCRTDPKHPKSNEKGLYPLHRVLMENEMGRLLRDDEVVHHIDGDKSNNNVDNLEVMKKSDHIAHHKSKDPVALTCPVCGEDFEVQPSKYRLRMKRSKSDSLYCSKSCGATAQHARE